MGFKIVTWNINGLRSFGDATGWRKIFTELEADIICVQETKINRSAVEDWMAFVPDFSSYFSFPRGQLQTSGYSGVASFCRESSQTRAFGAEVSLFIDSEEIFAKKNKAYEFDELDEEAQFAQRWPRVHDQMPHIGLPPSQLGVNLWKSVDSEGRCIVTKHGFKIDGSDSNKNLFIFNVYCPRNDESRPERLHFQLRFYHMLEKRAFQLLRQSQDNFVIIVGDYNTTHRPIDVYDDEEWSYAGSYSRKWLDELLTKKAPSSDGPYFYDAFRHLNPDVRESFTCWNTKLGCRTTNYGSRLDYIVIDHKLLPHLVKCYPLTDFAGSDHCPVVAEFDQRITFFQSNEYSKHCTKQWPEFGPGTSQASIKNFFTRGNRADVLEQMQNSSAKRPNQLEETTNGANKKVKAAGKSSGQVNLRSFFQSRPVKQPENVSNDVASSNSDSNSMPFLDENSNSSNSSNPATTSTTSTKSPNKQSQSEKWKAFFAHGTVPKCTGHGLPCVKRKVRKEGPTQGREFYCCPKTSVGPSSHPESRCNFFKWVDSKTSPKKQDSN